MTDKNDPLLPKIARSIAVFDDFVHDDPLIITIRLVKSAIFTPFIYHVYLMMFTNPDTEAIRQLLKQTHTVAVVGLSPNESRPSFRVAHGLQGMGYRIIPVRPMISEVLGERAYPDLESLPMLPDIVDVFRAAEHVPAIVESCIRLGIKHLWLQDGIIHEAAAVRAQQSGITVIMDRCMWRDCIALCGRKS